MTHKTPLRTIVAQVTLPSKSVVMLTLNPK
jgi:hypothetical protein